MAYHDSLLRNGKQTFVPAKSNTGQFQTFAVNLGNCFSMLDDIGHFSFYCSGLLPPLVFVGALYFFRQLGRVRRVATALLFACAIFVALYCTWASIYFRDGMGPDAITSEGAVAWERSRSGIAFGWCVGGLLVAVGVALVWSGRHNHNQNQNQEVQKHIL